MTLASSVFARENLSEPARLEFSALVRRGVSSLRDLLTDFMCLARLDTGLGHRNLATLDAATLLIAFGTTSQPLGKTRGLFLKIKGPASLVVEGDQQKVLRILQNLFINALKYTKRGGVTITWQLVTGHPTGNWMFCVKDTGPGIHQDADARPLPPQIRASTETAHAAERSNWYETTIADRDKAETLPSQSEAPINCESPGEGVGLSVVKHLC